MVGEIMDPSEGQSKQTAYDAELNDPYAYPELSEIDQKRSEMEKGSADEESKTLHNSLQQASQPAPAKPSEDLKLTNPLQEAPQPPTNPQQKAPQASKPAPVSSSESGAAAANLMSKVEAPREPAKAMADAPKNSEHSHNIKEEGKSTCKCLIQ
jgi:hypothetical protein